MIALRDRDRRTVLDAAVLLSECGDRAQLAKRSAERFRALLHADVAAFTYINVADRRAVLTMSPAMPEYTGPAEQAGAHLHDNPITAYWTRSATPGPTRVSDHLSRRAWLATSTYVHVFGPMGTPHLLGIPVERAAQGGPSCAVSRSGGDFTDRDLGMWIESPALA